MNIQNVSMVSPSFGDSETYRKTPEELRKINYGHKIFHNCSPRSSFDFVIDEYESKKDALEEEEANLRMKKDILLRQKNIIKQMEKCIENLQHTIAKIKALPSDMRKVLIIRSEKSFDNDNVF